MEWQSRHSATVIALPQPFAIDTPFDWDAVLADGHGDNAADDSAVGVDVAVDADGGPQSFGIIVEMGRGGPQAKRDGIRCPDVRSIAEIVRGVKFPFVERDRQREFNSLSCRTFR